MIKSISPLGNPGFQVGNGEGTYMELGKSEEGGFQWESSSVN